MSGKVPPLFLPIDDLSRVGEARRAASAFAEALGFDENGVGKIAIIVTEAATNVARHGRGGHLHVRALGNGVGLEVLAVDKGPGMSDPERCLRDGYSTGGTPGTGLGAIKRLAHAFDLYSAPGAGPVVLARLFRGEFPDPAECEIGIGAICVPAPGERLPGDGWAIHCDDASTHFCVADGLGHGPSAHEASAVALEVFRDLPARPLTESLAAMHHAMRATRGAAVAVGRLDPKAGAVSFAGVGNISCTLVQGLEQRSLASHNGIVGHEFRRSQEFTSPWREGTTLVLHSDGVATRWRLSQYSGLANRHPAVIAAVLYRDFVRGRDDATVLVMNDHRLSVRRA